MRTKRNTKARANILSANLATEKHDAFLKAFAAHQNNWPDLQQKLASEGLLPEEVQQLELLYHLADITADNDKLVTSLQQKVNSVRDMALTYDRTKIKSLLSREVMAENIQEDSTGEHIEQYANHIEKQLFQKEPTAVVTRLVKDAELPIKNEEIRKGVLSFFEQHPDFNIRRTSIYAVKAEQNTSLQKVDPMQRTAVMDTLKQIQRITALSERPEVLSKIMEAGITSAHAIVAQPQSLFVKKYGDQLGGEEIATQVYQQAADINMRNEFALTSLRDMVTGVSVAAIDGKGGKAAAITALQEAAEENNLVLNWEALFGNADMCECEECRSIYSASAYLVELLQYLRNNNGSPNNNTRDVLDIFLRRRPDIGNLQLTCENAHTALPYIDLVNEIMESFIVHVSDYQAEGQVQLEVFNVTDETSEELLAIPQHINYNAYRIVNQAVFPFTLPYNQPVDAMRLLLEKLGTSRHALMETFTKFSTAEEVMAMQKAKDAESLGLSREEFVTLTKEDFYQKSFYDAAAGRVLTEQQFHVAIGLKEIWQYYGFNTEADMLSTLKQVKKGLLPRAGISFKDLVAILETRSVNAARLEGAALAFLKRIPYSYRYLQSFVEESVDPAIKYGKVIKVLEDAFSDPADSAAVSDWIMNYFEYVGSMIVVEFGGTITGSYADEYYYDLEPYITDLWSLAEDCDISNAVLQHLDGTSLTAAEYDMLQRFIRLWRKLNWSIQETDMAIAALTHPVIHYPYNINWFFLHQLVEIRQVKSHLAFPINRLLAFWIDIQTFGDQSLYQQLFLARNILSIDPVFAPDANGIYLPGSPKISDHIPGIMAALQLSAEELALIRAHTRMGDGLSIHNLSVLFRYGTLARLLKLDVKKLLQLAVLSGNPFTSPSNTLAFITLCEDIQAATFSVAQLNYITTGSEEAGITPTEKNMLRIAKSLHDALLLNKSKFTVQTDVTASLLQQQLLLAFSEEMVNNIMAFLNGTMVYSAMATANLQLPTPIPTSLAGRFHYDAATGQVLVTGILSTTQWELVRTLSTDPGYQAAIANLIAQPAIFINDTLFAFLAPGSTATVAILQPDGNDATATEKIDLCYQQFMPFIKKQQAQQLIVDMLARELKLDTANTEWLLTDMLTGSEPFQSLTTDIEKLTVPAPPGETWDGYISPLVDDIYTFIITSHQAPALWLDDQVITLTGTGSFESAPQRLKAGQLYKLRVTGLQGNLLNLSWKTPTVPRSSIPVNSLLPDSAFGVFAAAYLKLHKAALLLNGFSLTAEELKLLLICRDGFDGMDLNSITLEMWRGFKKYTTVRNGFKDGTISLAAFLAWVRNPVNGNLPLKIVALTGWDLTLVTNLISTTQFNFNTIHFTDIQALVILQQAITLAGLTGMETSLLFSWSVPGNNFDTYFQIAESIRSNMRSRYTLEDWQQVIKPVNDQLRTNQRNALISYLLVQPPLQEWADNRNLPLDADTLFEFFLIDVQMESVMETSRIRQALSSVQTFVQRSFMGLENEVPANVLDRDRWEWMQQYRVWEANRKVFVYPENYIEPELRDSKSPFFRELEAALLQQDITPENVENAIRAYLNKLVEVSSLDISAVYQEWQPDGPTRKIPTISHVFARTHNVPYVYFYRKFDHQKHWWTPWEKIETDIQLIEKDNPGRATAGPQNGNYLVPVVWKNRLLLFWPVFIKKTIENPNIPNRAMTMAQMSDQPPTSVVPWEYRDIKLAWSEYKDGKWTAKQTSSAVVSTPSASTAPTLSRFIFLQEVQDEMVKISVNHDNTEALVPIGAFTFRHGNVIGTAPGTNYQKDQHYAKNTGSLFMHFHSGLPAPVDLTLTDANGGADAGVIFSNPLADYKLVRTLQKDFHNHFENYEVTFFYQEDHNDDSHNRVMVGYNYFSGDSWMGENFYHPYASPFLEQLNKNGLPGLLSTLTQQNRQFAVDSSAYRPHHISWPDGGVDFGEWFGTFTETWGSYSIYNWELFFHIPLIVADRLSKSQQFEQARNWFHYIFNPLADGPEENVRRYWQFLPFKTSDLSTITDTFFQILMGGGGFEVAAWRDDPFNPHLIARMRPVSYMKTVVMKYLDNLIAWGDHLYRQNTMETINQAIMLYVMAGHILGPRPQNIPPRGTIKAETYNSLKDRWDIFGNAMVEMELVFPNSGQVMYEGGHQDGKPYHGNNIFGFGAGLYFGIPDNPQLLQYWDTVADRLFKIRHSMNIDGILQKLALFEPPIDPALLVQAAANGLSLSSVLNDINVSMPFYRFPYLSAKAYELCNEVKALGGQLLSVIEKGDAEGLAKLRSTHEVDLQNAVKGVRMAMVDEARSQLEVLNRNRENTSKRLAHFQQLLGITPSSLPANSTYKEIDGMHRQVKLDSGMKLIDLEIEDMDKARNASLYQSLAGASEVGAGIASFFPTMSGHGQPLGVGVSTAFGGQHVGAALAAVARGLQTQSARDQFHSNAAAKKTSFLRQRQDWVSQANNAGNELMQIDKQILAANIRINITEKELTNQQLLIDQANAMKEYLTTKYTNQQLYQWMEGQARTIYRQAYQLAYDMARKAEKAFRFERGEANSNFIQFAFWDSHHDGLLAGEKLSLAIRQMERAYQDTDKRDYEITKHISLVQVNPVALMNLKETGTCEVELPEELFDLDFAGHYRRRIKNMRVSIPCIVGPFTSVSLTLTLLKDTTRMKSLTGTQYAEDTGNADDRFAHNFVQMQAIATSSAQNDSGLFELNFRDERFLPFEGAGAISRWRLELPAAYRQFDYDTISDVILHMNYTARDGGGMLKQAAVNNLDTYLESAESEAGLARLFNLRHEFSSEWYRFLHPVNGSAALPITGLASRLPFFTRSKRVRQTDITGIDLLVRGTLTGIQLNDTPLSPAAPIGEINHFTLTGNFPFLSDTWQFTLSNGAIPTEAQLQDAWLIVRYAIQTN